MTRKTIEVGSNPSRFIGASYNTPCLMLAKLSKDYRPLLTLQLVLIVIWIKLPWKHFDTQPGYTIGRSWGGVWSIGRTYKSWKWGQR